MKKQIPQAFVFDIEGTLYKKGALRKGIASLFEQIKTLYPEKEIMFITGMNHYEGLKIVSIIENEIGMSLNATIASNAGNFAMDSAGNVLLKSSIDANKITKLQEIVKRIAPTSIIVYRTSKKNFRDKAMDAEKIATIIKKGGNVATLSFMNLLKIIEISSKALKPEEIERLAKDNEILSIDIAVLPKYAKKLATAVHKELPELTMSASLSLQLGNNNKLNVIENLISEYGSNICYLGDSKNDEVCLAFADTAVCAHSKRQDTIKVVMDQLKQGKLKIATNDLTDKDVMNYILTDSCDSEKLIRQTQECFTNAKHKIASKADPCQQNYENQ